MTDIDALRERYLSDYASYEELASHVRRILEGATREIGLVCRFESRAKTIDSFLKKAIRKGYGDPNREIRDKAGVRVIAPFYSNLGEIAGFIRDRFNVDHFENKRSSLAYNEMGYLGQHFEVRLKESDLLDTPELTELPCEIQLHTSAETAWAAVAHDLVYKPPEGALPPPEEHQRSVYRLAAFVEVFDEEADRTLRAVSSRDRYGEARMLLALERPFYRLFAKPFDSELSIQVLSVLAQVYDPEETHRFAGIINEFVARNESKLRDLDKDYRNDERRHPLLFQPETIAVFERLETKAMALRAAWTEALPEELLEGLADVWGEDS
ncbi:MAG TPA: RelA/SpoT domain-containing protein [Actinomycetota bacterium]|nr:RelA/SpoT domain-containing protein [Actinomycetota bacterium]